MARFISPTISHLVKQTAIKSGVGVGIFGTGYGFLTRVGHEGLGSIVFGSKYNRNSYSSRSPTRFKLPYYRYRTSRYGRRYSRYGRRYGRRYSRYGSRKRFFSRYRTRRFY